MLSYYGFRSAGSAVSARWTTAQKITLAAYVLFATITLGLWTLGRLIYQPETSVAPGGIDYIDGSLHIFFQREAGLLSSWQPSFSGDEYYVLGLIDGTLMILLVLAAFAAFRRFSKPGAS